MKKIVKKNNESDKNKNKYAIFVLEAGKIFIAIMIIIIPIIFASAYLIDLHWIIKLIAWLLLFVDFIIVFHIIDRICCSDDYIVNANNDSHIDNIHDTLIDKTEYENQIMVEEYLENKKEGSKA